MTPQITLRDYQQTDFDILMARYARGDTAAICEWEPGLGKESPVTEPVLTPRGWRPIGDLQVGDEIIAADGTSQRVTGVFPQGAKRVWRVEFRDGTYALCGAEHLWRVCHRNPRMGGWRTMTASELAKHSIKAPRGYWWKIPIAAPFEAPVADLPIPPYAAGVLFGDGSSFGQSTVTLSAPEHKLPSVDCAVAELAASGIKCAQRYTPPNGNGTSYFRLLGAKPIYRELGCDQLSVNRRVPQVYMFAAPDQRLAVLRGLMDSDGTCSQNGSVVFSSCSPGMAEDVAELVRGLGGIAVVRSYDRGEKGTDYHVGIRLPVCPFRHHHFRDRWSQPPTIIKSIARIVETDEVVEQVCISVSSPDHLYVTRSHIVTHNTLLSIMIHRSLGLPRMLVVCPAIAFVSWPIELQKWWPEAKVYCVRAGKDAARIPANVDVLIVTMDLSRNETVRAAVREWARGAFAVVDEAQYLRGPTTQRTGSIYGKGEGILTDAARVLLMSGTLVVSWDDDLWTHLARWMPARITIDGQRLDYEQFRERFFVTRRVPLPGGYGHRVAISRLNPARVDELRFRLAGMAVTRTKADAKLPPLTWHMLPLELAPKDRKAIDDELMDNMPERIQTLMRRAQREPQNEELQAGLQEQIEAHASLWAVMNRVLGAGKAQAVSRIIADQLENSPPTYAIGVFAINHNVMDVIDANLSKYGVCRIDGSTSPKARAAVVDAFQRPDGPRVFNGQTVACGTALTLTRASRCYCVQMSPTPGENFQAVSRFHRIGQENPVDAFVPFVAGTVDQALMAIISAKQRAHATLKST